MPACFWRMDERFSLPGAWMVWHQRLFTESAAEAILLRIAGIDQCMCPDRGIQYAFIRLAQLEFFSRASNLPMPPVFFAVNAIETKGEMLQELVQTACHIPVREVKKSTLSNRSTFAPQTFPTPESILV